MVTLSIILCMLLLFFLVVSPSAARSLTEERQGTVQSARAPSSPQSRRSDTQGQLQAARTPQATNTRLDLYEEGARRATDSSGGSESVAMCQDSAFSSAVNSLCEKIKWASDELKVSSSVEHSIQLCHLIKASADALQSLKASN